MKKIENYAEVQATTGEFARPTAGGYVCKIVNVEDIPVNITTGKGDYLRMQFDIAEGEFAGYYKEQFDRWGGNWNASFIRSYKETALGMFKHFTTCIEKSNAGFEWNWDEDELIGKVVGLVLGEEEYQNASGAIRTKLVVKEIKTPDEIRCGDFKVPAIKRLAPVSTAPFVELVGADEEELPF